MGFWELALLIIVGPIWVAITLGIIAYTITNSIHRASTDAAIHNMRKLAHNGLVNTSTMDTTNQGEDNNE